MAKKSPQIQPQSDLDLLSECQHRAAHLISCGVSYRQVADRLGLNPCTLSEWQKVPAFRAEINRLLLDAREATQRRLVTATTIALETLLSVCSSSTASDRDKISAASQILSLVTPTPMPPGPTTAQELQQKDEEEELHQKCLDDLTRAMRRY